MINLKKFLVIWRRISLHFSDPRFICASRIFLSEMVFSFPFPPLFELFFFLSLPLIVSSLGFFYLRYDHCWFRFVSVYDLIDGFCRRHRGVLRIGRWRGLRRTFWREGLCLRLLQRREKITLLALFFLDSSFLSSLDHVSFTFWNANFFLFSFVCLCLYYGILWIFVLWLH